MDQLNDYLLLKQGLCQEPLLHSHLQAKSSRARFRAWSDSAIIWINEVLTNQDAQALPASYPVHTGGCMPADRAAGAQS
jgi:hypothetical protein